MKVFNVVINNEEEANSRRLNSRLKMRVDHVETFVMMTTTPTCPSASSQYMPCESSSIIVHGSSPPFAPHCISPLLLPHAEEPSTDVMVGPFDAHRVDFDTFYELFLDVAIINRQTFITSDGNVGPLAVSELRA
ncbi:hypothetical protein PVK06_035833 [Gossypium arboreum]|uniref:Uncharacterized protein n=1 Tax=Gossypium arboreum TaxID=29729 RepID=A0ABR0NID6_GOSAR|nr:hypothetical protein PVK06_035833 [Gossypium arboreum]